MVKLDCSDIFFYSQLDEKHLFEWALEIPGVIRWEQDTLVVRSTRLSELSLREILSLFHRYRIPMQQLQVFMNERNMHWYKNKSAYWYKGVFGE